MNYFNKAEKTLKSCLKEKLSITTATVVGFLIAGTVVFGQNSTIEQKVVENNKESTTIELGKGEETVRKVIIRGNSGDITLTGKVGDANIDRAVHVAIKNSNVINKADVTGKVGISVWGGTKNLDTPNVKQLINEGNITASKTGIYSNRQAQGYADEIINRGTVKVIAGEDAGQIVTGVYAKEKTKVINENEITVKATSNKGKGNPKEVYGLTLKNGATGVNNGKISVEVSEKQLEVLDEPQGITVAGVQISTSTEDATFINNKDILVDGKDAIGILITSEENKLKEEAKTPTIKVENTKNGNIQVDGAGAIGVKLAKGTGKADKEFTNNGTIILGSGTTNGYGILIEEGKATNNGTIAFGLGNKEKTETNNKAIKNDKGVAVNTGKIQITDKTAEELKEQKIEDLFEGIVANKGMLVDKDGNIVSQKDDVELGGDLTVDQINGAGDLGGAIVIKGDSSITGGKESITADGLNIAGSTVTIKNDSDTGVTFDGATINIAKSNDKAGKIVIGEKSSKADLIIANGTINGVEGNTESDIELTNGSSLTLNGTTINGNIGTAVGDTVLAQAQTGATVNVYGNSSLNGKIDVVSINIGNDIQPLLAGEISIVERKNKLVLSSDSVIGKGKAETNTLENSSNNTINVKADGQLVLEVGAKGETALGNSSGITITGTNTSDSGRASTNGIEVIEDTNGDILLSTGNLTGTGISVDLGSGNTFTNTSLSMENGNSGVYTATVGENNSIKLDYNKELFKDNGAINAINNGAMNANNLFENSNLAVREQQMKNIYEGSIYSETVRASYNSVKTFENVLRGMNTVNETGKWTAFGSGVYAKDSYDRIGHDSEIETTGLLAGAEYGLDTNTSVGFAFAGANQDVDSITGSADGTALYLGTYAKKVVGNYKFMAGLGYQYGDYNADNVTGYGASSASYNSNTLSAYVEGRYSMDLGSNIAFEPKLKLGYTYVDQDDTRDTNFGVSDASLSTFDTELGADLIKTYALKDGKANLVLGASYVMAFGDTDKEFTGEFTKSNGGFDIKGAELSENTGKFDLSVEVSKDNGFFYNGGLNLHVGSNDYRNYGVNFGAGYKF